MPRASHCHTSTWAPTSGPQMPAEVRETRKARLRGTPGRARPVKGSMVRSERLSFSSTK